MAPPPLYTIGHSTRSIDELLELLQAAGIRVLVDVRRFPASRRHPHFAQGALSASLTGAGIVYRHEPDLGGRRTPRPDSLNLAWREEGFRGYADHMHTAPFREGLQRVIARAAAEPLVLMCAEAVPWRCHRQLIADALVANGQSVIHLLGPGSTRAHLLNASARLLPGGDLVYPGPAVPAQTPLFPAPLAHSLAGSARGPMMVDSGPRERKSPVRRRK